MTKVMCVESTMHFWPTANRKSPDFSRGFISSPLMWDNGSALLIYNSILLMIWMPRTGTQQRSVGVPMPTTLLPEW